MRFSLLCFSLKLSDIPTSLRQIRALRAVTLIFRVRVFYRTYSSYSGLTLVRNISVYLFKSDPPLRNLLRSKPLHGVL